MNTEKTALLFIGLQASGKSTYYAQHFEKSHVRINLDTLHTRNKEKILLHDCIAKGLSFVVDNTNPTKAERIKYIEIARKAGYKIIGYFFQSVLKDCIARNQLREGKACIKTKGLLAISNNLEIPELNEGFNNLYFVRMNNTGGFITEDWKV